MISVFVPSHITGFFSIIENDDLLIKGSRGVGVLLDKGVTTSIDSVNEINDQLKLYFDNKLAILINSKEDLHNQNIILKIFELMLNDSSDFRAKFENFSNYNSKFNSYILINQKIEVPIGCGFGTSAGSAIGTAICINEFFNLGLSIEECGKYAHLAEVSFGSGLGDVIAELSTGIVKRTKPGAPGVGEVVSINVDEELYVLCKTFDEIETASIIENENHKKVITDVGIAIGEEFDKNPTASNFMKCSLKFAKDTNLISDEILDVCDKLESKTLGVSMAMLGNTAFALLNESQKIAILEENILDDNYTIFKLETKGIQIFKD
ncbi:MAG: pantoate kinase [Methanobacteriaceae archaeon]|nr:pantoate kinase [Methanobacteriaceae archaeon]